MNSNSMNIENVAAGEEYQVETMTELHQNEYPFRDAHPGYEFSHLKQQKHEVAPVISLPENSICGIKDLGVCSVAASTITAEKREKYAKSALVMFMPF